MTKRFVSVLLALVFVAAAVPSFSETKIVFIDEEKGILQQDIAEKDLCISYYAQSPFALNVIADSVGVGLSLAGFTTANLLRIYGDFPDYVEGSIYDSSLVPAIDRWAMRPYNEVLDNVATVTSVFDAALPVLAYGVEFLFSNLPKKDGATLAVMYLETILSANAIKEALKISVLRVRPYMYFEGYDSTSIKYHDFEYSFPSGHTMNAFAGATFLSYTFCQYYPKSTWRIPVVAVSYAVAVGTGILRVTSGNHFLTDVLAGAAIGSACGFLVPFAHTFIAKTNSRLATYSEKTGNPKVELAMLPLGMNVSIRF